MSEPISIDDPRLRSVCEYCSGYTLMDPRGNCMACGAPKKPPDEPNVIIKEKTVYVREPYPVQPNWGYGMASTNMVVGVYSSEGPMHWGDHQPSYSVMSTSDFDVSWSSG